MFYSCFLRAADKIPPPAPPPRPLPPQRIPADSNLKRSVGSSLTSRGPVDRLANPFIRSAAAQVAVHGLRDLLIARLRSLRQQRPCRQDLPRLSVAALRNLFPNPCPLQHLQPVAAQPSTPHTALHYTLHHT